MPTINDWQAHQAKTGLFIMIGDQRELCKRHKDTIDSRLESLTWKTAGSLSAKKSRISEQVEDMVKRREYYVMSARSVSFVRTVRTNSPEQKNLGPESISDYEAFTAMTPTAVAGFRTPVTPVFVDDVLVQIDQST